MGRKRKFPNQNPSTSDCENIKHHFEILEKSQDDSFQEKKKLATTVTEEHASLGHVHPRVHAHTEQITNMNTSEEENGCIVQYESQGEDRFAVLDSTADRTDDIDSLHVSNDEYLQMLHEFQQLKDTDMALKSDWYNELIENANFLFDETAAEEFGLSNEGEGDIWYDALDETNFTDFDNKAPDRETDEDTLIYPGAQITVAVSMLLTITFVSRHNITGTALSDLLTLISLHCAEVHPGLPSVYKFMKYFHRLKHPLAFHRFCSHCLIHIENSNLTVCPNSLCSMDITKKGATSFFIEVPIEEQIRSFFFQSDFHDDLQHRFRRSKIKHDNIEDIYDGALYQQLLQNNGILSNWQNLSLMWNTDGIPIFKSSNFSLWPLYFVVNELPYLKRIKRENMIFGGLWFGSIKPEMLTFLKPFRETLHKLQNAGVEATTNEGDLFTSKITLLCGTCDLPAKCMVCNSIQFNGYYGCLKCYQPGKTTKTVKGGHTHTFPFEQNDVKGPKRTHKQTLDDAKNAILQGKPAFGIKGPSWFSSLNNYDMIRGTSIDYMHGVLLGVMKMLLGFWFNSDHSSEDYSISHCATEVDSRLLSIKPPNNISRSPRSIDDQKHWKASELRTFLLYYSIPCLHGVLPVVYFSHFVLLSEAIYILLQESISLPEIDHAERLLQHFCIMVADLYGERYLTANVHNLLHLADDVKDLGPLWTHSCFYFEDMNGYLLKLLHGTQKIEFQVVTAISLVQKIPDLESCLTPGHSSHKFYESLKHRQSKSTEFQLERNTYIVGSTYNIILNENEFAALAIALGAAPCTNEFVAANRIRIGREVYHGESYTRVFRRNSGVVKFRHGEDINFGQIMFFFQYRSGQVSGENEEILNFAMVRQLQIDTNMKLVEDELTKSTARQFIPVISRDETLLAVRISEIISKCIFVQFDHNMELRSYIICFANTLEKD